MQKKLAMEGLLSSTAYTCRPGKLRQEIRVGTQSRNMKAGANEEVMEGFCLLACISWLSQSVFSIATCQGVAPLIVSWTLLYQSLIKRIPYSQVGAFPHLRYPLPR